MNCYIRTPVGIKVLRQWVEEIMWQGNKDKNLKRISSETYRDLRVETERA